MKEYKIQITIDGIDISSLVKRIEKLELENVKKMNNENYYIENNIFEEKCKKYNEKYCEKYYKEKKFEYNKLDYKVYEVQKQINNIEDKIEELNYDYDIEVKMKLDDIEYKFKEIDDIEDKFEEIDNIESKFKELECQVNNINSILTERLYEIQYNILRINEIEERVRKLELKY